MKQLFSSIMIIFVIVILSGCCYDTGRAIITVHNQSDYDVTDIFITTVGGDASGNIPYLSILEEKESHRFNAEWLCARIEGSFLYIIEYHIDGKMFDVAYQEDAMWVDYSDGTGRFVSPQTIKNGSVAEIFIRNESYEFVIHRGSVAWTRGNYIVFPPPGPGR